MRPSTTHKGKTKTNMAGSSRRILVTGGGTFLGDNITAALLAEGAEVTLLVRPGLEEKLGPLAERVRWWSADIWDPASLRGRARGHSVVIHTIGSMIADPAQGLTHHRLNFVSARNAATMCVSDGVSNMVLMSSVAAPWMSSAYIRSKREAEQYLQRVGVKATIIRAPLTYVRGQPRPALYELITALGSVPPTSWFGFGKIAPMPIDILARGIARIALDANRAKVIYYAPDLRRRNHRYELSQPLSLEKENLEDTKPRRPSGFDYLDENAPFGWSPPDDRGR
ncbi:MAG: NAD(P)-dependent oxidoreductase [bacterium]|nr:NAD(P)-dependent oxidoreductase [bacterium]